MRMTARGNRVSRRMQAAMAATSGERSGGMQTMSGGGGLNVLWA